jgi:hypothetical protein
VRTAQAAASATPVRSPPPHLPSESYTCRARSMTVEMLGQCVAPIDVHVGICREVRRRGLRIWCENLTFTKSDGGREQAAVRVAREKPRAGERGRTDSFAKTPSAMECEKGSVPPRGATNCSSLFSLLSSLFSLHSGSVGLGLRSDHRTRSPRRIVCDDQDRTERRVKSEERRGKREERLVAQGAGDVGRIALTIRSSCRGRGAADEGSVPSACPRGQTPLA